MTTEEMTVDNKEVILKTKDVDGITFRLSTILEWSGQNDKLECNGYYLTFIKDDKTYWVDAWNSISAALAAFSKIYAIGGADV